MTETPKQRVDALRAELCDPKVTLDMIVAEFSLACAERERSDVAAEFERVERRRSRKRSRR